MFLPVMERAAMKDIVCANNITKLMMSDSDYEPSFRLLDSFLKITGDIFGFQRLKLTEFTTGET